MADGSAIREYIVQTAREHGVDRTVRYGHRVTRIEWSSDESRWTVEVKHQSGEIIEMTCGFLHMCSGYYRYDGGFCPRFVGMERFDGQILHPQDWPENLDYAGKRVVVIGSGATAMTLVPSLAEGAGHVTMLQRSPTYVMSLPRKDALAENLPRWLSPKRAYAVVRWKNVLLTTLVYQLSRRRPEWVKRLLRKGVEAQLPDGYDVDTHFAPRYQPWDQRLTIVPNGDLFRAISDGRASVVTDRIETFTEGGLKLASGAELEADIIITATGLNFLVLGGVSIAVDGREVDPAETVAYKGMMFSGVPNLALALGYTNASWTLKCDLISEYVCRLLTHMDEHGYRQCTPIAPDPSQPLSPVVDLKSGYVLRALDSLPKQGARPP